MLVLTRKTDQKISIGEDITITVVRIKGNGSVQLGIEAPDGVQILRGELVEGARDARKRVASGPSPESATSAVTMPAPPRSESSGAEEEAPDRQRVEGRIEIQGLATPSVDCDSGLNYPGSRYRSWPMAGLAAPSGPRVGNNGRTVRVRAVVVRA
jgi:carbon storage regulator